MTIAEDYFMLPPNWETSPTTVFGFKTHARRSITGYEARNALLEYPVRQQQYRIDFNSTEEKSYVSRKLYGGVQKLWGIPLWGFGSPLTAQASSGQPVLSVDTTSSFFEVGQPVVVFDTYENYELEEVLSTTSSSITLTGNLLSTWSTGTLVFPILQGYMNARMTTAHKTSIYGGVGVQQREAYDEDVTRLLGSHTFDPFHGYDVFNRAPNWASGASVGTLRRVFNFKTLAIEYVKTYQTESDLILQFDHLCVSKADLYNIVSFFNSKRGKWKQFWIPTWTKDIVITSAIGASDTTLDIEDVDYSSSWSSNVTVGKWLYFLLPDDTEVLRKITGWPSSTQITIESSLGYDVSSAQLPHLLCSFLVASRFNADELEINHQSANVSEIKLNTLSMNDDTMTTTTTTTTT